MLRDMTILHSSNFLKVLHGTRVDPPPVWLMRQAGRYLPEYLALRKLEPDFMRFCFTPRLCVEAVKQPLVRFGFDAAILFSDILVLPHVLGQRVKFVEGEGPVLDNVDLNFLIHQECDYISRLKPIFEVIETLKKNIMTPIIGFSGTPWTVGAYMFMKKRIGDVALCVPPKKIAALIRFLIPVISNYLISQIQAGADAVMLFDSWAGLAPNRCENVLQPLLEITQRIRAVYPHTPIIYYGRQISESYKELVHALLAYRPFVFALDEHADGASVLRDIPCDWPVQGNLDPRVLIKGGVDLERAIDRVRDVFSSHPHVFNLGHGITPLTPASHVAQMVNRIRGG